MSLFARFSKAPSSATAAPPDRQGDDLVYVSTEALIGLRSAGEGLKLKTGRIASRQAGQYLSRFKGRGMEFDEARVYQAGDDVRSLDWRVTARTGIPHTKLFREERERTVLTWVDMRPSMFFATQGAFKSVLAARAAAIIAWSANKRGDRLGGLVFTAEQHHEIRPKRGKAAVLQTLKHLSQASKWQSQHNELEPDAGKALGRLRRVAKPGSLIFLFSDFRNLGEQAESHLIHLARHNDLVMFYIHDPLEEKLPVAGDYRVAWGERNALFNAASRSNRDQYQQRYRQHRDYLETLCRFPGVSFIECATHQDVGDALQGLR